MGLVLDGFLLKLKIGSTNALRAPTWLRISEFFQFYSSLLSYFLSHLKKWVKSLKIEAEFEYFYTWKVENVYVINMASRLQ